MIDEGYIKYHIHWQSAPPPSEDYSALIEVRNQLRQANLIGIYHEVGIGFGNVSQRSQQQGHFIVSGTQTGELEIARPDHFTLVTGWNLPANELSCRGPLKASSESLTHAALYDCDPSIQYILHIHHLATWQALLESHPSTAPEVAYGTPAMAREVYRLYRESDLPARKVFAMAGHEEGVFAFGASLDAALKALLEVVRD